MKLICWNINGLRSVYKKGLEQFLLDQQPDILCLQEIKVHEDQLSDEQKNPEDYSVIFSPAQRRGYSGVATYFRKGSGVEPKKVNHGLGEARFDNEGRYLISEHKDFILYNLYIPSGTTGDVRQEFKYEFLDHLYDQINELSAAKKKKLIICGDFNICHREIDIHHPSVAEKRELSGFLPDERKWVDKFLKLGLHDSFREVHGDTPKQYTWWSFRANSRAKNLGWRIDYAFVGKSLKEKLDGAEIHAETSGSDHCPIELRLSL